MKESDLTIKELDIINTVEIKVGDKFEFRSQSGCWNCSHSIKWDRSCKGRCEVLTKHLREELKKVGIDVGSEFYVDSEDVCKIWKLEGD